ncbi:MAG: ZIP family metal transporter [Planctomycetota bacterium]|jgi:zinc and cadmium transporter
MSVSALLVAYCLLIVGSSLAGGWIPLAIRLTHKRMEILISFVSGVMLGVALLHLLPHAWAERAAWLDKGAGADRWPGYHALDPVLWWMLAGFLAMFFIERFFCFHHHELPDEAGVDGDVPVTRHRHELTWTGAAVGLSVHSLIAGMALAASVKAQGQGGDPDAMGGSLAGLGVFLAIFFHKPFDSMTLGTLMAVGHRSRRARHLVNAAFGLLVPLGVGLFCLGVGGDEGHTPWLVSIALAFSAGTFLCISLSDLLPELQFHQHDRVKLSAALVVGLVLAWGVGQLEEGISHESLRPFVP